MFEWLNQTGAAIPRFHDLSADRRRELWSGIRCVWHSVMDRFGLTRPADPFDRLALTGDGGGDRLGGIESVWWPTAKVADLRVEAQARLTTRSLSEGWLKQGLGDGAGFTLELLGWCRGDEELVAAALILASLFPRAVSAHRRYPQHWPPRSIAMLVHDAAYEALRRLRRDPGWRKCETESLPVHSTDEAYRIEDLAGLVRYLAEEQAVALVAYRPTLLSFSAEGDPSLVLAAADLTERLRAEQAAARELYVRREAEARLAREARLMKHPWCEEWRQEGLEVLRARVWTWPMVQLADRYGVSNVAILKRCKQFGVPTPKAGFWRRVATGAVAHPRGVVQVGEEASVATKLPT